MRLRSDVLPRTPSDIGCFLLLFTFIPVTFVFEMTVVVPEFHDTNGFFYILIWIFGLFLMFNIKANMLACMLVDTSIKIEILTPPMQSSLRKLWRYCHDCETLAPPRSWHCPVCSTCILKRDHHCLFTGCCIGHRNHRYFFFLILYLALGTAFTTAYNTFYFLWLNADIYANRTTALKMICPMLMLALDLSWHNFYLLIYELNTFALVYSVVLIIYHAPGILIGAVIYERTGPKYDLGWKRNLQMILGRRLHLAWLSPFVKSELPHDGVHWERILQQSSKNR